MAAHPTAPPGVLEALSPLWDRDRSRGAPTPWPFPAPRQGAGPRGVAAARRQPSLSMRTEPLISTSDILSRIKQEVAFVGEQQFGEDRGMPADPCAGEAGTACGMRQPGARCRPFGAFFSLSHPVQDVALRPPPSLPRRCGRPDHGARLLVVDQAGGRAVRQGALGAAGEGNPDRSRPR